MGGRNGEYRKLLIREDDEENMLIGKVTSPRRWEKNDVKQVAGLSSDNS